MSSTEYAIENGWLVEVVNEHTCGTGPGGHYGAHEPGCGMVPVARVEDLLANRADSGGNAATGIDASPEPAPVDPAPLNGPQIANLRPKVQALVMKYVALAWNQGYRVGWDDRDQDYINPLPAGLFHDTPNPYEQEDGDA